MVTWHDFKKIKPPGEGWYLYAINRWIRKGSGGLSLQLSVTVHFWNGSMFGENNQRFEDPDQWALRPMPDPAPKPEIVIWDEVAVKSLIESLSHFDGDQRFQTQVILPNGDVFNAPARVGEIPGSNCGNGKPFLYLQVNCKLVNDSDPEDRKTGYDMRPWVRTHRTEIWHYYPNGHFELAHCGEPIIPGTPLVMKDKPTYSGAKVCLTCRKEWDWKHGLNSLPAEEA